MGRKIPAKKHRGVKDPLVQQARRFESLKGKINAPPKDPDEQPVPRSLTRLFAFQNQDNKKKHSNKRPSRHVTHQKDNNSSGAGDNPVSRLHKLPGESGRGFSLRINSAIRALHNAADQLHYPLETEAEAEDIKGMRMWEQRERRARKRRRNQAAPATDSQSRLTRTQKLALKKKANKLKASEARQEVVYERVSFGEVSHAPPALPAATTRPGQRDLLLSGMLQRAASERAEPEPRADLLRRERARLDAVAAYRALKHNKHKNK